MRYEVMGDGGRLVRVGGDGIGRVFVERLQSVGFHYVHDRGAAGEYPTTISTAAAGSAYPTDVAPANAALATFSAKAGAWTSSTSNTQAEADAQPAITALQNLNTALTNGQRPGRCHGGCPHAHRGHRSP